MRGTALAGVFVFLAFLSGGWFLLSVFNSLNAYGRKTRIYAFRENLLRLEYYRAVDDHVGVSSTLSLLKDEALALGDERLKSLVDSLQKHAEDRRFADYVSATLSHSERLITDLKTDIPFWMLLIPTAFIALAISLITLDFLRFRRGLRVAVDFIERMRLGVFVKRTPLLGDFQILGEALSELAKDLERTRRNAQHLIQT